MSNKIVLSNDLFFSRTADFLNNFLVDQCNRSEKTKIAYRDALTMLKRYVEYSGKQIMDFKYSDCTYEFVLDFKEFLSDHMKYKTSSINQRVAAIQSYLKYSYGCDSSLLQTYIGISGIPRSTMPKTNKVILSEKSIKTLLNSPPPTRRGLRDTLIMTILYDTGIRLDELVKLKVGDIYESDNITFLIIHGKGNKERKVSVDENTKKLLQVYLKKYHENEISENPLIYTTQHGKICEMSHRNIQKLLKKYSEQAAKDCPELAELSVHPHLLRRSRATELYQNGTPIEIVARFLGHSSIETTKDHYAFPSIEQMRKAMESGTNPSTECELWSGHEDELAKICGLR